jgi:dienelactone hydrolase
MTWLVTSTLILATLLQTPSPAPQPTPDVVSRARAALDAMIANDFAKIEAQFTDEMKAALPPGKLAAGWASVVQQAGALKGCGTEPRVVAIAEKQMVITPCEFERATLDVQFAFDSAGRIAGMVMRPAAKPAAPYTLPPYASPSSFSEREITIGSGEWALPATLTVPAGAGAWPAIVLVHGSGPNDRDETVGPNRPFKDLATGLASRGVAVLRYDKRTKVHGAKLGAVKEFTVKEEVVDDVLEAVKTLRAQQGVDPRRVFVLGHSLGGMLIPRIATADPTIAGLIVLAGPARPLEDAIVAQTRYLVGADGTTTPVEQKALDEAAAVAESVRALKPEDAGTGRMIFNAPPSYWLDLRGYDPPSAATRVKQPMLILHGERDYQVTMEEFAQWKAALGSRTDVRFHSYPTLNHLFIAGTGPRLPAEYQVPGHVAEDVVRDIAAWIHATRRQ